ncbi:MAG: hypothetical protein N2578_07785, partial [Bdellovibrionaceae bacterium]|nr:hypothetical protein [Pseudobdellovibrionaceae bacterium]
MSCADKPDLLLIDPVLSGPEGLVGVGGELSVANLFYAYSRGVFPWPIEGQPMLWFCPPQRGVLDFKDFHIPRSVQRLLRKAENQGITCLLYTS